MVFPKIIQTNELRLLLYFCQLAILKKAPEFPAIISICDIDWTKLFHLATYHKIRPLVYSGLKKWENKDLIPPSFIALLKRQNLRVRTQNMRHASELSQIIQLLKAENIEIIPYKGVVLGQEAYQDLGIREASDIDLLIQLKDFPTFKRILETRNYEPETKIPSTYLSSYFKHNCEYNFDLYEEGKRVYHVEPHWFVGKKKDQLHLGYLDLLPFTKEKALFGTTIRTLTPEGLLLTTTMHHGGQDKWQSLKQVCDIAAILEEFDTTIDWDFLLISAKKLKVGNLLLLGIGLAVELFSIELPAKIHTLLNQKKLQQHIQQRIYWIQKGQIDTLSAQSFLEGMRFHISLRKNVSTKLKVVYYHFLQLMLPNMVDLEGKETSKTDYYLLTLKKPFRIWESYLASN